VIYDADLLFVDKTVSGVRVSSRSASHRPEIDGLRAIAIVLVIVFHSGFGWIAGGFIGVDVFFVISGFLIGGMLLSEHSRSGRLSLREFYGRRARRLLPLSSLVIATTVILGMIVSVPVARQQVSTDAISAALYVSNWTFARQAVAYSDRTVNDGLFTQFWSLSIEEQFYLLLPLIFLAVLWWSRRAPAKYVRRLFGVVVLLVVISFASSIWATGSRGSASYFLTYTRLWELGVGVAVAIWFQKRPVQLTKKTDFIALVGLTLIFWSALTFNESLAYPGWRAAVPVIGTALVLVFSARTESALHRTLALHPFVVIGTWSYGWYLWHWPMIGIAVIASQRWFPSYDTNLLVVTAIAPRRTWRGRRETRSPTITIRTPMTKNVMSPLPEPVEGRMQRSLVIEDPFVAVGPLTVGRTEVD
jgi:peptidoglycan/LPS O-acetylase OafA/YrhL